MSDYISSTRKAYAKQAQLLAANGAMEALRAKYEEDKGFGMGACPSCGRYADPPHELDCAYRAWEELRAVQSDDV